MAVTDKITEVKNSLYNSRTQRNVNNDLDKNAFLYILTTELGNQDPTNAKDNTEYVAQLAQFSALEQMQNLNASMYRMLLTDRLGQGTNMIGKEVKFNSGETEMVMNPDNTITYKPKILKEIVKSVVTQNGEVLLATDKDHYFILEQVMEVGEYKNGDVTTDPSKPEDKPTSTTNTDTSAGADTRKQILDETLKNMQLANKG